MSLTTHLNDSKSPVRGFLKHNFPNARRVVEAHRAALADAETILPRDSVPPGLYSLLGIAVDYRLRYFFGLGSPYELVAYRGALLLCNVTLQLADGTKLRPTKLLGDIDKCLSRELVDEFFAGVAAVELSLEPWRQRLKRDDESVLAKYCIILALFEQISRGGAPVYCKSPLVRPEPKQTVAELLSLADNDWVDDLCSLSWGFYDDNQQLIRDCKQVELNPTFEGSNDVGGADGDLILDGCLIDIKTTVNPRIDPAWLYQLLGYALLDYSDSYKIRELAIYLARQRMMFRWPIEELMSLMTGGDSPGLEDVRSDFKRTTTVLDV